MNLPPRSSGPRGLRSTCRSAVDSGTSGLSGELKATPSRGSMTGGSHDLRQRSRKPAPRRPARRSTSGGKRHGRSSINDRADPRSSWSTGSAARLLSLRAASSCSRWTGPRRATATGGSCCAVRSASQGAKGVFEQAAVERLEDELDRAAAALLGDLRRVTHANMSDEIEFFIRALDADLIVPGDF